MPKRYVPIEKKLRRIILSTLGAVMLSTFAALLLYEFINYRNIALRELEATGQLIAVNSSSSLAFADVDDANQVLRSLQSQEQVVAAALYDRAGKLLARYGADVPARLNDNASARGYRFEGFYITGYEEVHEGDRALGVLYIKSNLGEAYDRLALYAAIAAIIIVVSVLLAFIISRRLQRTLSRPILELAEIAAVVTRDQNYGLRARRQYNDEVGQLTDAFNEMLARIEEKNAEILCLNQNLEEKVAERTRQLQETNAFLQAQKEFTETIIDASIDLIAVFDSEGHYLAVNQQCVTHFKRSRVEMLGHRYYEVFPTLRDSLFMKLFKEALGGKTIHEEAYRSQVSNRWFQNFFIPLKSADGSVEQVLVVGHDITEIMESNARLKALNTDLEKSNQDLEQFAYIASHDLQEPLRKIQTFTDLSQRNLQHSEILQRYLSKIASSAARMSSLIRDVLNYSRLSRRDEESFGSVDLNEVLRNICSDLELVIEEKSAVIDAGLLPQVRGSQLQLSQLFLNLIGNALKFNERKPLIEISCRTVDGSEGRVALKSSGTFTEITFADNGIGFDPQYADKVFAIFQRLQSENNYSGTGIGLALCKKIVENHGGGITVESTPGAGTRFFVYLPLTDDVMARRLKANAKYRHNSGDGMSF